MTGQNARSESRSVYIHADESCLGNQNTDRDSPGGAGGLLEYWHNDGWTRRDFWLSEPATTNNRMALKGAIVALNALKRPCEVVFVSDSQYLVRGASEWIHGWRRSNWRRKGGVLENAELWQELDAAMRAHRVEWKWVRGHAGHPRNEYANYLAIRAAREQSSSDGVVPSGFEAWLRDQREKYGRYLDFDEWRGPPLPD